MHKIVNPQQTQLFDPFDRVLTEKTRKRLLNGWPGVFRDVILELMPVDAVIGHFEATGKAYQGTLLDCRAVVDTRIYGRL